MVFLLNIGLLAGTVVGPNTISLFDGRGLQMLFVVIGVGGAALALLRRVQGAAPEETGEAQAVGIIGVAQPGVLQAESWIEDEDRVTDADLERVHADLIQDSQVGRSVIRCVRAA